MTRPAAAVFVFAAFTLAGCSTVDASSHSPARSARSADARVSVPVRFIPHIREASQKYGVDPALIAAVVYKESRFDPNAVSSRGAQGLMQLMPRTAAYLGVRDAFDPRQNILGGTRYLREMLDEFDGDVETALAAYNAGPVAVKRAGMVPPNSEAEEYVRFIRSRYSGNGVVSGG